MSSPSVLSETVDGVTTVAINRPEARNAVDRETADALAAAFVEFAGDETAKVAILHGVGGNFCAGADLKAVAGGSSGNRITDPLAVALDDSGPMGPSRLQLDKPVIAAVNGYAVAGGLELALWCDLRVAGDSAIFGVFCRRWGVPLIDGGTVRLPRVVGQGRALDMILTGRPVDAAEALAMGLANRVVADDRVLREALSLARQIAAFPQECLRADRRSVYRQFDFDDLPEALRFELDCGRPVLDEAVRGAARFADGEGRGGAFE